jgi:hypothetical protein
VRADGETNLHALCAADQSQASGEAPSPQRKEKPRPQIKLEGNAKKKERAGVKGANKFDHAFSAPCLTREEVENVIKIGDKQEVEQASLLYKGVRGKFSFLIRRSRVSWLELNECRSIYMKVFQAMEEINNEHWGIQFDSLQVAQYTIYGPLCHYTRHMDLASGVAGCRKISATVNLTDPSKFVGGRLDVWRGEPSQDLGDITVFPAYLLHGVMPVWWGTRKSLVFWATGRPFS